jgi:pimeloyl-ACP methyl ester carboxylesterase
MCDLRLVWHCFFTFSTLGNSLNPGVMCGYKIGLVFMAGIIFSCNQKDKSVETSNNTGMDSIKTEIEHHDLIQGPAGKLHFDDGGTGDSIPVVFVHSFGGNTAQWKAQLDHLRKNRRAIAFDFRGHGESDLPVDGNYTPDSIAQDIAAVVDSLDLDKFVLVGHSMGGSSAVAYAGVFPERVAGLLLTGTPGKTPAEISNPVIAALNSDAYKKVMDDYMKKLLTNSSPEVDSAVSRDFKKISKEASLAIISEAFRYNPLPSLQRYDGPKLIIATPGDVKQPQALINQAREIPHKIIEGTSHWSQMDKPQEFNKILDDFLKRVEK